MKINIHCDTIAQFKALRHIQANFEPYGVVDLKLIPNGIRLTEEKAKQLITEFCESEYTSTPDFGDLHNIGGIQFYFPQAHAPWLRGTNENTNGLLREYLPRGVDIKNFSNEQIQEFVYKLNTRPRKCLGWKTPYEIFFGVLLHLT